MRKWWNKTVWQDSVIRYDCVLYPGGRRSDSQCPMNYTSCQSFKSLRRRKWDADTNPGCPHWQISLAAARLQMSVKLPFIELNVLPEPALPVQGAGRDYYTRMYRTTWIQSLVLLNLSAAPLLATLVLILCSPIGPHIVFSVNLERRFILSREPFLCWFGPNFFELYSWWNPQLGFLVFRFLYLAFHQSLWGHAVQEGPQDHRSSTIINWPEGFFHGLLTKVLPELMRLLPDSMISDYLSFVLWWFFLP